MITVALICDMYYGIHNINDRFPVLCCGTFYSAVCWISPTVVSRFIKYTGYGNAAGLLAARGLMRGGRNPTHYSEDEDSDTEEYREAKPQ